MLEEKGQSSFELPIITVIVLAMTTIVIAYYIQISDTTVALAVAKESIAEKLAKWETPYMINTLDYLQCGTTLKLNASTIPAVQPSGTALNTANFDTGPIASGSQQNSLEVQNEIKSIVKFQAIVLGINDSAVLTPC